MKKNHSTRSAFTNFRILLAFTFCLAALSLVAAAFARPAWSAETDRDSQENAKTSSKSHKRGGASKSTTTRARASKSTTGSGTTSAQPLAGGNQPISVTEHRNELGQMVYSIATSWFDISLPARDLATSAPEVPSRALPELQLPPWRTIRSDKPDPVTQVVPGPKGL